MEITINGVMKQVVDFSIDVLALEQKRLERKMLNMEQLSDDEMSNFVIISKEIERRSENNG